jgi:hypothetical protein
VTPLPAVSDVDGQRYITEVLVLVTGNKFIAGAVVTGDNCSPVSLSPAMNLSLVALSLVIIVLR